MKLVWYSLQFPQGIDQEVVLPWIRSLAARPRRGLLGWSEPLVLEVEAGSTLQWRLGLGRRDAKGVIANLRVLLPSVRLTPLTTRQLPHFDRAVELRLNTFRRPMRSDIAEGSAGPLLAALNSVRSNEILYLQWLIGPWLPRPVVKRSGTMRSAIGWEQLIKQLALDTEDATSYKKKLSEPLLGATLRIGVQATRSERQSQLLQRVIGALQLTRQPGVGLVTRLLLSGSVVRRIRRLYFPLISWPIPINAAELTAVLGWPLGNPTLPGVEYASQRQLPPTPGTTVPLKSPQGSQRFRERVIGKATYPGQEGLLYLPAREALHHLHVIGPTGVGKSTLLGNMIESDLHQGRGLILIEPKGDLVESVLARIPKHRLTDVVLIDPADLTRPVGLNVLACTPDESELVVDQVVHVLRELNKDSWGPRTQDILTAGLLTLAKVGGQTLCELPVLLTNDGYRRRLLGQLHDPLALGPFWAWYESLRGPERTEVISPVLNKLRPFTYRRTIRSMLGQAEAPFRIDQVFREKKVLLVNLAKGTNGPQAAQLLGSLLFNTVWQTALGRVTERPDQRHVVPVYVDEWQDFIHLPTELGDVLAQARGLGVALTLAHQHLGQLTPAVKAAVLANARSRIVFQTGATDAGPLALALGGGLTAADLQGLGPYEIYASLMRGGSLLKITENPHCRSPKFPR